VDEVKYRTTWSAVDGRPFTRTNTVPMDDRANADVSEQHADAYCSVNVFRARNKLVYVGRLEGRRSLTFPRVGMRWSLVRANRNVEYGNGHCQARS
jgi:hypothetical protein